MNTEWSIRAKYVVGVGLALFLIYLLYISRVVLPLVIIAALIAYLVMPLSRLFHYRLRIPWGISVLITYLLTAVALLLAPLVFLPPLISGFNFLLSLDYRLLFENALQWVQDWLLQLKTTGLQLLGFEIDLDTTIDPILAVIQGVEPSLAPELPSMANIVGSVSSAITFTLDVATGLVGTVFSFVFVFTIILLTSIYISLDADRFYTYFLDRVPTTYQPEVANLLKRLRKVWESFFRGQLTLMIFIGTAVWLGGTVLGLPGAFALGVIAGLLEIIPNIGPVLAAIPAVLVALLQGSSYLPVNNLVFALIIIGFYVSINLLENNIIVPRLLGGAVNLHPVVIIVGVFVGATTWGILGALLAAPVIASGREIVGYLYRKILGEDPFPPEHEVAVERKVPSNGFRSLVDKAQYFVAKQFKSHSSAKEAASESSKKDGL